MRVLPAAAGSTERDVGGRPEQLPLLRPGDVVTYCFNPLVEGAVEAGRDRTEPRTSHPRCVLSALRSVCSP